ncbi:hypothetical protein LMH87_002980 [Akanthomyces muscarius]|uniref:Fungal calcium binding protein domain-containing protein n=1 Tax=Akanthomyces muscarius TaxID=2231603 RepID=A0A9W8Q7E2_AKAMU|nr:hypothetical protein LMH87_002980 [Akanthomyces muscarius]KAJ4148515.1 hypothetical protein LMH87_002980 [Akanthomyces muscarius]
MRFATIVASLTAAGVVNASPTAVIRAPPADKAYTLHIEAAECNTGKCLEVLAAAGCIALAIAKRSVPSLLGCVSGATGKLCGCAGCIDPLGDFLEEQKVC